jgi:mRNA interferase MazF
LMTSIHDAISVPNAGDLVWADLRPWRGREKGGVRPVVVLTDRDFHLRCETAIVCLVTSNRKPWPSKVLLPPGLPVGGAILADEVRTLDRRARGFRPIGRVPDEVLSELRGKLAALVGIVTSK